MSVKGVGGGGVLKPFSASFFLGENYKKGSECSETQEYAFFW